MSSFIDDFMQQYGSEVTKGLTSNLGINKKTAAQLIPQVLPLVLGGLRRQKDDQGGAPRVDHILNKYGSASVLNNILGTMSEKAQDDRVDPRLGGLLGESGIEATKVLANNFKLDSSVLMKMIPMISPIILGALTRKRDTEGAGASGIAALLDQDGDGSVLDDVAGFLLQGLSGSGKRSSQANVLGGLLSGLFGKKR
ncbi:DUF937 domain-containing protein [candidate division KSB1 bacterium]|nr:DUF937 domain-containing protein [candidate division KSB1 bacterium]